MVHGSHNGRIFHHEGDSLGRWATQILRLKNNRSLSITTAYRPCSSSLANAGEGTILKQQFRELRRQGIANPNPRT